MNQEDKCKIILVSFPRTRRCVRWRTLRQTERSIFNLLALVVVVYQVVRVGVAVTAVIDVVIVVVIPTVVRVVVAPWLQWLW